MNLLDWPHLHRPAERVDAPALLLLHGTGGTETDLVNLAERVAPGALLVAPRGRVAERGAARFFARLSEGVFDPAEVASRARELAGFVQAAHQAYAPASTGFYAIGFSNGANIAAAMLQLTPEAPLAGAVLLRPMVVIDHQPAASSLTDRHILMLNGTLDPLVPADHPGRLADLLRSGGADVRVILHPDASHGLCAADIHHTREFLASAKA